MKIDISEGIGGDYAKVGKDIRDGDIVKILDAGQVQVSRFKDEDGKSKDEYVFKVRTKDTPPLNLTMNKTSRVNLGKGWGNETLEWVDKKAKAFVVKQMVGDGLKNVLYLAPEGWEMNDEGGFYDPNATEEKPAPKITPKAKPQYDVEAADEMAENSPF